MREVADDAGGVLGDLADEGLCGGGLDVGELVVDGAEGGGELGALVGLADGGPYAQDDLDRAGR